VLLLTICRRPPLLPFLGCWKEVHETTHTQAKTPFATRLNPFPKRLCHDNIIAASSSADINDQKLFLLHIVTKSTANTPMGASSACCLVLRARPKTQGVSAPSNERFLSHGPAGCYPQTRQPPNCYNLTAHSTFSLRCCMEPGSQNRILAATQARLTPNQQITTQSHVTKMTDLALRTD
jgi:hypothetical protein